MTRWLRSERRRKKLLDTLKLREDVADFENNVRLAEDELLAARLECDTETLETAQGKLGSNETERDIRLKSARLQNDIHNAALSRLRNAQFNLGMSAAKLESFRDAQRERWIEAVSTSKVFE